MKVELYHFLFFIIIFIVCDLLQSSDHSYPLTQFEGYIDAGKHLSLLHSQLVENITTSDTDTSNKFSDIQPILTDLTMELENRDDDFSLKVSRDWF